MAKITFADGANYSGYALAVVLVRLDAFYFRFHFKNGSKLTGRPVRLNLLNDVVIEVEDPNHPGIHYMPVNPNSIEKVVFL